MWGLGSIDSLDHFKWVLILTFKEEGMGMIEQVLCARSSPEENLRSPSLTFPNKHPRRTLVTSYRWAPLACNDQVRATRHTVSYWEANWGKIHPKVVSFHYYACRQLFVKCLCIPFTQSFAQVTDFFSLYAGWGHFLWGGTYLWGRPGTHLEKSQ